MFFRFLLRRLAMWSALLVLGLGAWLGLYASSQGLAKSWKLALGREFARQGITLSIGKLTLDPLHGLVARDVRVYDSPDKERVLVDISRIDLDVSLPKLLQQVIAINSLHVRGAEASLPVDPARPDGERLEISEFFARVLFSGEAIQLQELRGRVFGVACNVRGELIRRPRLDAFGKPMPSAFNPGSWRDMDPSQREKIRQLVSALGRLASNEKTPAELDIHAMADLANLEEGRFTFAFRSPELAWDGLRVQEVSLRGQYDNGLLQAEEIRFRDAGGAFRAEADFVRSSRTLRFNVDSHTAVTERLRRKWWPESWPKVVFKAPASIAIGGSLVFPEGGKLPAGLVTGSTALGAFTVDGTPFEYASAGFAFDGRRVFLRDLNARRGSGVLRADILLEGTTVSARGQSSLRPPDVAPFVPVGPAKEQLAKITCGPACAVNLGFSIQGDFTDSKSWRGDAAIDVKDLGYLGVPFDFVSGHASLRDGGARLAVPDLKAGLGGGTLTADVGYEERIFRARGQSNVHPELVAPLVPDGYAKRLIAAFACGTDSFTGIGFTVQGDFSDPFGWAVDTSFETAKIRFHNVPIATAKGNWQIVPGGQNIFTNARLEIPAGATLAVQPGETTAATVTTLEKIVLHPQFGPTEFHKVRCTGWPHTVIAAIVPETLEFIPPFKLSAPADLAVDGILANKTGAKSDLKLALTSGGLLEYPAFKQELPLQSPDITMTLKDRSAILSSISASLYGGRAIGNLRFDGLGGTVISSGGHIQLTQGGYQDVLSLFNGKEGKAQGTIDIIMDFTSKNGSMAGINAAGSMRLLNGDLFSIPLFGPLSPLIEAVLPNLGFGYSIASTATATYDIRDGVLTTNDFNALTPAFKMDGHGTISLPADTVEFFARFNARGIAQVATYLLSYIFEYKCEGALSKPVWSPLRIPKIPLPRIPLPSIPGTNRAPKPQ